MALEYGFEKKQFYQIKQEIEDSLVNSLGEINVLPPSIFANIIAIFAERETLLWEQLEAIYNSNYPLTAEGYSLDGICALNGVKRREATKSKAICQLTGILNTKIPKNSKIISFTSNDVFELTSDTILSNEQCSSICLKFSNLEQTEYVININGIDYTYLHPTENDNPQTEEEKFLPLKIIINALKKLLDVILDEDSKKTIIDQAAQQIVDTLKPEGEDTSDLKAQIVEILNSDLANKSSEEIIELIFSLLSQNEEKNDEELPDNTSADIETLFSSSEIVTAKMDGNTIIIAAINYPDTFSCFVSEGLTIENVTNHAQFFAQNVGAVIAPALSLNSIYTPVSGWLSVVNEKAAIIGTTTESDIGLRARREESLALSGSGTIESIKANLLNINSVTNVSITENASDKTDGAGIPPHSFKVLITGGEDTEIAQMIWQKKPAGIQSIGNIPVTIKDSFGNEQVIKFDRPVLLYVYVQITITKTTDFIEESTNDIKEEIISYINALGVNNNVLVKALYGPIFNKRGVTSAVVQLDKNLDEDITPTYTEIDIAVDTEQVAFTDISKIEIILEDA